ncbi:MAG: ATP-binding protein [Chloroflexota bacterium]
MSWKEQLSSLRLRLILTYIGFIVLGLGGVTWLAEIQLTDGTLEDFTENLHGQTQLVASALAEPMEGFYEGEITPNQLTSILNRYASNTDTDVVLLDFQGNGIVDHTGQRVSDDIRSNPEIQNAFNNLILYDLRDDESGQATYYAASPIYYEGQPLGFVRLSAADTGLQEVVVQRRITLIIGFGVMAGLALLLSFWLASTLTQPLAELRDTTLKLAEGDLSQRVKNPGADEIGAVAIAFNQMADQVQNMVEEQRAFASNVSHELRTPLTTIRLRTEALQDGLVDEKTSQQYITEIDSEANRLGGLVDDLILLSRLEANRLTQGQEQVDPLRLAKMLIREMYPFIADRQVELIVPNEETIPAVQANMNHIRVVFRNLFENAIKYSEPNGQIRWQLENEDNHLKMCIIDDGQGISAEDLPHVNKRFYRADKARSRLIQGVGLGLNMVQSIIELYGGRFKIESPGVGQGTTVTVWWPIEAVATPDHTT